VILRPYQQKGVNLIREYLLTWNKTGRRLRPIFCLPTGAGKTVVFSYIAKSAQTKGLTVAIIAHRTELLEQAKETIDQFQKDESRIHYSMVQTCTRSPHKIPKADLYIIDETHIGNFKRFLELLPLDVQVIGVTATPVSASKKSPLREIFDKVISPVNISDLIREGYLSKPTYHIWELDESKLQIDSTGDFSIESLFN